MYRAALAVQMSSTGEGPAQAEAPAAVATAPAAAAVKTEPEEAAAGPDPGSAKYDVLRAVAFDAGKQLRVAGSRQVAPACSDDKSAAH